MNQEMQPDAENGAPHREVDEETVRVHTISPQLPFLKVLAQSLVSGELIEGFRPADNPLLLADCTIYLPTRRSARALGLELLTCLDAEEGSCAILLPRIRTLGDLDEDESLEDIGSFAEEITDVLDLSTRVIDPARRLLTLARLAKGWINSMTPQTRELFEREQIVLPSSSSDALRLASDLAQFMDQVETEEADWSAIRKVVDADNHARWWQLTLDFLEIIMTAWPRYLEEEGLINPAQFRRTIAEHRIARLDRDDETDMQTGPVIAAGSTGSIPATARLLARIARMKNGAVVLPGLDCNLPKEIAKRFLAAGELIGESASSTHPQFSMLRLLGQIGISADKVRVIGEAEPHRTLRETAINISLLPAEDTGQWSAQRAGLEAGELESAFEGVTLIEAADERLEALAIAISLREALEIPGKTAALVTPDRELARRVTVELERFDIGIDDSAGFMLSNSAFAVEVRHLLRIVFGVPDPVSWSAFLRSSLAQRFHALSTNEVAGETADISNNEIAGLLELALVRDCLQLPDIFLLKESLEKARERLEAAAHKPAQLENLPEKTWEKLSSFCNALSQGLLPLARLREQPTIEIADLAAAILETLPPAKSGIEACDCEGEVALQALLKNHLEAGETGFTFSGDEAVAIFETLLARQPVRDISRTHPRLQIFGTLEARLQDIDRVILGGLNEGVWPPSSRNDPFLNRPMRSGLGLPLPERRIGLAAHDFVQLSGKDEVFYTRSKRKGDAPSIASRWLQRMETFLGSSLQNQLRRRGQKYLDLTEAIDASDGPRPVIKQTEAKPPVEARPQSLSITEIETWIRDPYAIYARHVLKVRPLPPLVREADPALRGTLYHDIFADFITSGAPVMGDGAETELMKIADRRFAEAALPAEIEAIWRPRFDAVAEGFLAWERERRSGIAKSFCEVSVRQEIGNTGFTLRGRADRIDITRNGELVVIDYKTGGHPSKAQARTLSPQLALEGALARLGAFRDDANEPVPGGDLAGLFYVRLREGENFAEDDITMERSNKIDNENAIASKAMEELIEHIGKYRFEEQGYISRYAPVREREVAGDYDHLARVREWSIAEESDGEEEA